MTFPSYPKYKASGFIWLGDVPEHWVLKRLGRYFDERRERASDTEFEPLSVTKLGIVPRLESAAKTQDGDNRKKVLAGDFVINSRSDRKGSSGLSPLDGSVSLICTVLIPTGLHGPFIHHLLRSELFQEEYYRWGKGIVADLWSTNFSDMKNIVLGVPPEAEQTQIARFLDHETARIDALIEEQQRLIELLKEKRQAVISHAVTIGLDPTVSMKDSGVEWLGEVPVHWEIKRLKQLVIDATGIQMGPFGGMLLELDESDTGYKVYGQENTISGDFSSGNRWISEQRYFALSNYHLEVGDIVLTRKGSLGNCRRVSFLPQAGIIDSDTIRVRAQEQMMSPDYLELLLHEAGYISTQLGLVKRGAILSGLNSEIIANLVIIAPPRKEQEELLREIKAVASRFDQGISDCEYAVRLLRERRPALISAAVTGKIDVRGWQPPASAPIPEFTLEAV